MALRKEEQANLKNKYVLYMEVGLVLALAILVAAFRFEWNPETQFEVQMEEQEIVQMEEITQTKQEIKPPPPPRPPVPVEVPDDEILEDDELELDASLDIDEPLSSLPPPPPPPAEEEPEPEPEIFVIVEEMPELIGGLGDLQKKVQYPEIAKKAGVEGRVILQFTVDEQGNVVDPVVIKGRGAGLDQEALRVIQTAKFKPGKQRGKAVKVKMSLPITFKLR